MKKRVGIMLAIPAAILASDINAVFANTVDSSSNLHSSKSNPDWDNRLPNGNLLKVTENWLKKQHKRLLVGNHINLKFDAISANSDGYGQTHAKFKVRLNGIPVEGKEVIVHISENTRYVLSVQGLFEVESSLELIPKINRGKVISTLAKQKVSGKKLVRDPELVLYVRTGEKPRLAWRADVSRDGRLGIVADEILYVDANTGENFTRLPMELHARQRALFDSAETNNLPTTPVARQEGGAASTDNCVNEVYDNLGTTYDYFSSKHNRDSWDDNGDWLIAWANYRFEDGNGNPVPNALFSYAQNGTSFMVFGQATDSTNCVSTLDVVSHEFTHGVLFNDVNLATNDESGALHESISDVFGAMTEAYGTGVIDSYTWYIGEGVYPGSSSAFRYMRRPSDVTGTPDHYSEYVTNGDPHINNGIPNLAFYLTSQGGTHPTNYSGISVTGIGDNAASDIWYDSIRSYMHSGENFSDMRLHTMRSAIKIEAVEYAQGNIKNYLIPVANAWASVGVGSAFQSVNTCTSTYLNQYQEQVIDIYIAYYGRAGDLPGVNYWAQQLQNSGGNVQSIMAPFANSAEFNDRFGDLNNTQLVTNLYHQLFNREPDYAGLQWYVNSLNSGSNTLANIALEILNGATGSDVTVLNNRRTSAEDYYARQSSNSSLDLGANALSHLMRPIGTTTNSLGEACGKMALVDESGY